MVSFLKDIPPSAKKKPIVGYSERTLFPVLSSDMLLSGVKRQQFIAEIAELVDLPEAEYAVVYRELLQNFADFVQALPRGYGNKLGGLLNEGIYRGLHALKAYVTAQKGSKIHQLYAYAIFSSALLIDIGEVSVTQRVTVCDEEGIALDDWVPYLGTIRDKGDYYKIRRHVGAPQRLAQYIAPLLARQLMPEQGFLWLAEDSKVLHMWLAALSKDEEGAGGLAHYMSLVRKELALAREKGDVIPETTLDLKESPQTKVAEDFLAWLKRGLESGSIEVNTKNALVQMTEQGLVLVAPAIFQKFSRQFSTNMTDKFMMNEFNKLGLTAINGENVKFEQFYTKYDLGRQGLNRLGRGVLSQAGTPSKIKFNTSMGSKTGVMIKDPGVLFNKTVPEVNKNVTTDFTPENITLNISTIAAQSIHH